MRLNKYLLFGFLTFCCHFLVAQEDFSRRYLQKLAQSKPQTLFDSLMVKGASFAATDTALAAQYFSNAYEVALNERDLRRRVLAHIAAGEMLLDKQILRRAFMVFSRAKTLTNDGENNTEEAILANFGVARAQFYGGNYRPAILNFLLVIYLSRNQGNKIMESEAGEYLGLIYSHFQDYQQSVSYYRRCYDLKSNLNDDKSCLRIAEKLGDIYYFNRRFDSAYYYAHYAVQLSETLKLPSDIAVSRLNKAAVLIRLHQLDDAFDELRYFNFAKNDRNTEGVKTKYLTVVGNYWLQKGNSQQALIFYDSAVAIAKRLELAELYTYVYRNMAESFYENKDYKTAYEYYQKYTDHIKNINTRGRNLNMESVQRFFDINSSKDEIKLLNNENKLKELQLLNEAALRKNLETERKGLETENLLKDSIILRGRELQESLNREYDLQQAQLKNERNLRLSLLFGLSTALLLGGLVYWQFQKQKKKNVIIEKQSEELETLMKEIHHRVKNNLQVISSLLDLQALSINDEKAAYAVKESKNRVQSMALIHQNLYNEGNIKGIKMADYIQNLAQSLFNSYNIKPEQIKLTTDIDPLSIDVDSVIPIGLTLNELISNSLKYAFNDQETGEIHVVLKQLGKDLLLKVKDNGKGFKEGYDQNGHSFGFKIVKAFAQKLKAQLKVYNDNGACVEMRISKYKLA